MNDLMSLTLLWVWCKEFEQVLHSWPYGHIESILSRHIEGEMGCWRIVLHNKSIVSSPDFLWCVETSAAYFKHLNSVGT